MSKIVGPTFSKRRSPSRVTACRSRVVFAVYATFLFFPVLAPAVEPPESSSPSDTTPYVREPVPDDYLFPTSTIPGVFIVDVVVNNTNPALTNTDTAGDGETSIAVNPANPNEIVIAAFSGGWGNNAPIYHSTDGGITWTRQFTVPVPPGWPMACPCDWTWDWGRNNQLSATILGISPTTSPFPCGNAPLPPCQFDVVSGTTTNPAQAASWNYFDPAGPPVQAQETNINNAGSLGNADQPWVLVNPDPFTPTQDNVYVAYDDFTGGPDMRVAVSYGLNPPNFTIDVQIGTSSSGVNPGLRLAEDSRTGFVYALWGRCTSGCGADGPKGIEYNLNRSIDGGMNWSLNGSATGIVVVSATSTQPRPKFGTVNALLGGVHHAAVDPTIGDLYYAYGNRDAATGNDRLSLLRIASDGAGGVVVASNTFITGQVEAAIPVVAVTDNGTVAVFYYTFDGFSSDDFPVFTAHLALSEDRGLTFTDLELLTFLSSAMDNGMPRQRVLGDYMQMQAVGNCLYGSFTANGLPFGRPMANHDPIFFLVCVGPQIQIPSGVDFGDSCVDSTSTGTLNVCNTGIENLVVESITSSDPQFAITTPSAGFPVTISPDFCFSFEVAFSPTSPGPQAATLTIVSNDSDNPSVDVQATGNGTEADINTLIADNGDFGDVCLGDFRDLDLTISNSGDCDLTVECISSSSTEFKVPGVMSFPLVIGPGDSLAVPIRFEPTSLGSKNATITITSDDPDMDTVDVDVSGNVPPGEIAVTGSTDFGDICAEDLDMAEITVAICNVGACNLEVMDAVIENCPDGDFEIVSSPFPATVSSDFCIDVVVRFTPSACGPELKMCDLVINSDDPDTPVVTLTLTASTPCPSIDVPLDQAFPPTVIQSVDACDSQQPFPVSNTGSCNLVITDLAVTTNTEEFSLSGLPSFPIILQPGHVVDVDTVFAPEVLDRNRLGEVTVTYVDDPVAGTMNTVTRTLCGEGVRTGARVLVTYDGVPVDMVKQIKLRRINANSNQPLLDTIDTAMNLALQMVTPTAPCTEFQFHREYATVDNPIQLLPGAYHLTARIKVDGHMKKRSVGFDVSSCDFNPSIEINFGGMSGYYIQPFVDCVLDGGSFGSDCVFGDMDENGITDVEDIPAFVESLLAP